MLPEFWISAHLCKNGSVFRHMEAAHMIRVGNADCHMVAVSIDRILCESVRKLCPSDFSVQKRSSISY